MFNIMSKIVVAITACLLLLGISYGVYRNYQTENATYALSMFYCGFSGQYCGQSTADDVNPAASIIILAFANTLTNGAIQVDDAHFPTSLVQKWQNENKKVVISAGAEGGNWHNVFSSSSNTQNFISSVVKEVSKYKLDGVDLDIEAYEAAPSTVSNMINQLKTELNKIGQKLIIVSPEDVTVYQGSPVPDPSKGGNPFNYFVPIIKAAGNSIDYYQPQAYNNWYDGYQGGSLDYLKDVYLNWRNLQGLNPSHTPIPNFSGVPGNKLLMGVLASSKAGGSAYYASPTVITELKSFLGSKNYPMHGFMIWDSHWDTDNGRQISNAVVAA